MRRSLDTFGKDLNQETLKVLCQHVFFTWQEILKDWQGTTLAGIMDQCLFVANDYYLEEAFSDEDIIITNKLIIKVRTL